MGPCAIIPVARRSLLVHQAVVDGDVAGPLTATGAEIPRGCRVIVRPSSSGASSGVARGHGATGPMGQPGQVRPAPTTVPGRTRGSTTATADGPPGALRRVPTAPHLGQPSRTGAPPRLVAVATPEPTYMVRPYEAVGPTSSRGCPDGLVGHAETGVPGATVASRVRSPASPTGKAAVGPEPTPDGARAVLGLVGASTAGTATGVTDPAFGRAGREVHAPEPAVVATRQA